jgi:hypothetical protein
MGRQLQQKPVDAGSTKYHIVGHVTKNIHQLGFVRCHLPAGLNRSRLSELCNVFVFRWVPEWKS